MCTLFNLILIITLRGSAIPILETTKVKHKKDKIPCGRTKIQAQVPLHALPRQGLVPGRSSRGKFSPSFLLLVRREAPSMCELGSVGGSDGRHTRAGRRETCKGGVNSPEGTRRRAIPGAGESCGLPRGVSPEPSGLAGGVETIVNEDQAVFALP